MPSSRTGPGFWDENDPEPIGATIVPSNARRRAQSPIKDDWEDDDEDVDEEIPTEERNKQIWEDANAKVHHPMPDLILSRNAVSIPTVHLPPQGVFDQLPKMKILKRPSTTSPGSTQPTTDGASALDSLREREARYNAARERIFGNESPASSNVTSPTSPTPAQLQAKVVREPRGPSGDSKFASSGFEGRNSKPPSADNAR